MFKKIPFEKIELETAFTLPGRLGAPGTPVRTTPVTARQNYDAMVTERHPYWMPTSGEILFIATPWSNHMGRGGKDGLVDDLGITWVYEPIAGGSIVRGDAPQLLEDVNDWKDKVHLPDISTWEWPERKTPDTRFPTYMSFSNGFAFERMISMMGFMNASMALLDEDQVDAIKEMLQAFADFGCECIKDHVAHFPEIDIINIHDDWGSQQNTFFSEDIAREIFLPYMKQLTDCIHSLGRVASLHSCGHNDKRVQVFIDAGFDEWAPQTMNDIEWLYDNYGDKIILTVWPKETDEDIKDLSEEEIRALARKFVDRFNQPGKPSFMARNTPSNPIYRDEVYKYSRELWASRD